MFLVSPSSTDQRLADTVAACRGWVYATSVMGVTGARSASSTAAPGLVARIREAVPEAMVGVGLGVSNGAQAREIVGYADAAIVGSALVKTLLDAEDAGTPGDLTALRALVADLARGRRGRGGGRAVSPLVGLAPLFIPSPERNVWHLGPLPLRAYALCIIAGIVVGMVIATRRWRARGGTSDGLESVVVLAVPFGIVGARIYHVITDYELYFGPGRNPVDALKIWQGGLGIWGAVALGALGGWLVARRRGIRFPALLDACAPGLAVAQGIGRLGNWFNSELFGRPTTLPWGLEIAPGFRPAGFEQYATFHPTFLYELIWDVAVRSR